MDKFKDKKQFRHKAEIPLTILSVILSIGLLCLVVWCLIQIPNNPDFKQILINFFGFNKDSIDGLVKFGGFAFDVIVTVLILYVFSEFFKFYGKTASVEVELSQTQMPEVYKICQNYSKTLNIKSAPVLYFYTAGKPMGGILGVPIFTTVIRLNSNVAKSFYDTPEFKNALEFLIAADLGHIYLGHARPLHIFSTFIAKMIPVYGHMYNRVLNYSADKIAAALVGENAAQAVAMSVIKPKNTVSLDSKHLFKEETLANNKFEKFCIWYNNILSYESPVAYRREAIENNVDGQLF